MEEERAHRPWNFHSCDLCVDASKSVFVTQNHLDRHERLDFNPLQFSCKWGAPEIYKCEVCDFQNDLKVTLSEHLRVSHRGKEVKSDLQKMLECYECKNCCFKTCSLLVLLKHECQGGNQHLSNIDKTVIKGGCVKCEQCLYQAKRKEDLKKHILNKHTSLKEINWHECEKCSYKAKLKVNLKQHILYKHTSSKEINWYECENCSYKTKRRVHLKRHILSKHTSSKEISWYVCDKCSYKAKLKDYLKKHVSFKHTSSKEINWHECDKCAKRNQNLKRHITAKHTNSKEINWYECHKCSYTAKHRRFEQTHFEETYYSAKEINWHECNKKCSYQAKLKDNLKQHILRKHGGSKK